jgi:hypothetical protein
LSHQQQFLKRLILYFLGARPGSKFIVRRGSVFERCAGFELLRT